MICGVPTPIRKTKSIANFFMPRRLDIALRARSTRYSPSRPDALVHLAGRAIALPSAKAERGVRGHRGVETDNSLDVLPVHGRELPDARDDGSEDRVADIGGLEALGEVGLSAEWLPEVEVLGRRNIGARRRGEEIH